MRFGLIPELVGRLPVISPLESLDEESMVKIMTEPKNSVLKQYEQLFNMDGIRLTFEPEALKAIAKLTVERKTGARGLRSIFESTLIDTMYDLPGDKTVSEVIVTKKCVLDGATPKLVKKKSSKSSRKKTGSIWSTPLKGMYRCVSATPISLRRRKWINSS